ncbi:7-cyano-7-deazaguanine synthase QueC [Methylobacterium nodulans]|uniref:7-cyano-7-deazaguanine synthase n=1 Tax=Methylobacterium nodulans (strain LMG 21967 / CNCM I-2342 / ORS 2060) TaxID=460265 RepID=B8IAM4_METNO|nr:7-cyano-7-deazaguanine synthase QueC [Methylobacterium nodulans]ACL61069.1 exsB protein [Methylobacterium nodulans ORS 2060]
MSRALVVLSGGQDSTTCLFWAKQQFDEVHALTFDYGQRHARELEAAVTVAKMAGVASHEVLKLPDLLRSTSPLVDPGAALEQYASYEQMEETIGDRVELTFVPMRNALFLTIAANRAVALDCFNLVTGVCQQDNANYPDCRLDFVLAQQGTINQALGVGRFRIHTPLMHLTKAETVKLAGSLPGCWEALAYSHTAYDGAYPPTGRDHATLLRAEGFRQAGLPDPLVVRAYREGLMPLPETDNYDGVRASAA